MSRRKAIGASDARAICPECGEQAVGVTYEHELHCTECGWLR